MKKIILESLKKIGLIAASNKQHEQVTAVEVLDILRAELQPTINALVLEEIKTAFTKPVLFSNNVTGDLIDRVNRNADAARHQARVAMLAEKLARRDKLTVVGDPVEYSLIICKHCNRSIELRGGVHIHTEGLNRGKQRCDPHDSQLVYGYNADPVGANCSAACLGVLVQ